MNYFQIALDPKETKEDILQSFIREIESSEVIIESKEKFDENYPLKGFNIHIKVVDEMLAKQWQAIIFGLLEPYEEKVTTRFRLHND